MAAAAHCVEVVSVKPTDTAPAPDVVPVRRSVVMWSALAVSLSSKNVVPAAGVATVVEKTCTPPMITEPAAVAVTLTDGAFDVPVAVPTLERAVELAPSKTIAVTDSIVR
jgi:hypothetical protein